MNYAIDDLILVMKTTKSAICVGLDPFLDKIPDLFIQEGEKLFGKTLSGASYAILKFNKTVLELLAGKVAVVKPQFSLYLKYGPEGVYAFYQTISYAKQLGFLVIADAKSNDIDSSMEGYVQGFLGEAEVSDKKQKVFNADFLTVNPYLGSDSYKPLKKVIECYKKGAFILSKTSNKSSAEYQDKDLDGYPLYLTVAKDVSSYFSDMKGENGYLAAGIVVGATMPEQIKIIRKSFPGLFFLIPGFGAQGGDIDPLKYAFSKNVGFIVNASRSILYSYLDLYRDLGFEKAIIKSCEDMNEKVNSVIKW